MIVSSVPAQARLDMLEAAMPAADEYRLALYAPNAALGEGTPAYTPDGEVKGSGYEAGGALLDEHEIGMTDSGDAFLRFGNVSWPIATLRARGALVYNATKPDKPALAVLDFGETVSSTNGPFLVELPMNI